MKGSFQFGNPIIMLLVGKKKLKMLLDTGFNGELMIPQKIIDELHLEQIGISDYVTASGEAEETKVYKCTIDFFGGKKEIAVLGTQAPFALAGMELFHECEILIERHKNRVEIRKTG